MMMAHEGNESDDDDPIKLFDLEQERVHFGTKSQEHDKTSHDELCQAKDNVTDIINDDVVEYQDDDLDDFSENDCRPLYVKLVDCKRFPWYYKKYSQQIINKIMTYDLVSDSDNELDIQYISDDNSDCFITNEITTVSKKVNITSVKKRQATMKVREDFEIQLALRQKNVHTIDLKRNKGLIGITIKQKSVEDTTIQPADNAKVKIIEHNTIFADKYYLSAADRILCDMGTELPISKASETLVDTKVKGNQVRNYEFGSDVNKKVPLQYNIGKQLVANKSRELSCHDQDGKRNKCSNDDMTLDNVSSSLFEVVTSSRHIKDIKKTNKYLNKKIYEKNSSIENYSSQKQKTKIIKDNIIINDINKFKDNVEIDMTLRKIADSVPEPHSPILPSSLLKKSRDVSEIYESYVINKSNSSVFDKTKTTNESAVQFTSKCTTEKMPHIAIRQDLQEHFVASKHINQELREHSTEGQLLKKDENENNHNKFQSNHAKHPVIENSVSTSQDDTNNLSIPMVLVDSVDCNPINYKITPFTNTKTYQEKLLTKRTKSKSIINKVFKQKVLIPNVSDIGTNVSANKTKYANPYASAIILKPNQPMTSQNADSYIQQSFGQKLSKISIPQYYNDPYSALPHSGIDQNFIPLATSCTIQNCRYCLPHNNNYQIEYNAQYQRLHFGKQRSNILSKESVKDVNTRKKKSLRYPITQSETPKKLFSYTFNTASQPVYVLDNNSKLDTIPQLNNYSQVVNNSANAGNMNGLVKAITTDSESISQKNDEQVHKSRTHSKSKSSYRETKSGKNKVFDILGSATNILKRGSNENAAREEEGSVKAFKRPRAMNKNETITIDDHRIYVNQQKGYSPPVLPIPTYEKIMSLCGPDKQKYDIRNESNGEIRVDVSNIQNIDKCGQRVTRHEPPKVSARNKDKRKISLDEYKRRISQDSLKKVQGSKINNEQQPNVLVNVDRFSTERDLGYDSDGTVII